LRVEVRPAERRDASQLVAIEGESFPHPHWKAPDFFLYDTVVAEVEGRIAGFLVSRQTAPCSAVSPPEREILNLAVAAPFRRLGIGSVLLSHELQTAADFFLEVRESNVAAQTLYRRFGFVEVGRRDRYYQFPMETAIVMKMKKC
jgi:ribosomal-protein-alanine N-acetyltransferase